MRTREQAMAVFTAIMWLIGIGVAVQLWLLAGALEGLLSDDRRVLVPATVASCMLALLNARLVLYVFRLDARIRRDGGADHGVE